MPSVPFKKCSVCGGKIPGQDPHSACLFCLGETHVLASCALCKSLTPQARKNRETRLKAAIYTKVFTSGAMSSVGASSFTATPLPTLTEAPTQSPLATRAMEVPSEPQGPSEEVSRPPKKDKKDKHKKAPKESREVDKDSSAHKGSASKSSVLKAPTSSISKSGSTSRPSSTKTLTSPAGDKSPTQTGTSTSSKRPCSSSLDGDHHASKRRRSLERDQEGSPQVRSDIVHRRSDTDRRPSDTDSRPSDPRLASKRAKSSTSKTHDTSTSRSDRPLDLALGSRPLPTFRHTSDDAAQLLLEPASPAGSGDERRSPTPMPTRTRRVVSPSPPRDPEPDYYYDSETGRYYRLVSQEDVESFFEHRDRRPRPRASSRPSRVSAFSPRRAEAIADPEVVNLESDEEASSQARYRPRGDSLSSRDDDYQSVNQDFAQPGAVSPSDDVRTFAEHVIKMSNALDIKISQTEEEASDPIERRVHGRLPTPPAIPLLPSLEKLARRSWEAPASTASNNRKVASLYRISPTNPSWLFGHPKQNSAIVEGSQRSSTPKASLMPSDKEAKKIDALAKKAYFSSALGMRVANYNACMGAYIQWLMEKVSPLIPDLPDESQAILSEVRDEAHSIGGWLITSARHTTDCSAKFMAAAIALRRHAWLRSSDLNQNARSTIEDMPFDEDGLFHRETDEKLNFKYRMRTAAKKHAEPVVCNDRLKGRLLPCQHPGVPSQVSGVRRRDGRIQIQCPSLRPIYSSSHFYQVHGAGDITPAPPRHEGLPVSGRLALRGPFTSGTAKAHLRDSQTPTGPGTGGQPRKIPTASHQANTVHRLHP
ncbi:serine/arginine repetitive matrix protein 1-like [Sceloporus undulatus]|uniref:serine/arginine repetitive matrix protein 1-like n=1 Tax=Sceloporus undulatus TaxID=8520 RepID=UPI001C4D05A2|nr:serine/arginine repetitive matrix protein 1-like [Sceloporus undulatus]